MVNVRSGSISPPAVPGIRLCPLPRFSVRRRPLARQKRDQFSGDVLSAHGFRTKNLPPGVVTPLNCHFSTAKQRRGAGALGRVKKSFSLKEESLRRHLRQFAEPQEALSLLALGRWVPSIAELMKRVKRARKAKAPTSAAQFGVPPPHEAFPPLLSPATCRFLVHPAALQRPERREAEESREPAG